MKTITIILVAVLTLQMNVLFASNDGALIRSNRVSNASSRISLAPVTPAAADFEEIITVVEFSSLAPVTPTEASFEDAIEDIIITKLAPVTPIEADFNDEPAQIINICSFAPVAPTVVDFDELK